MHRVRETVKRQHSRRGLLGCLAVMPVLALSGCVGPKHIAPGLSGHVVILPGIGGKNPSVDRLARMIDIEVEGVSAEVWDWTRIEPIGALGDLVDIERNRGRAEVLADQLAAWRAIHPETKLYLIAHSGGAGVVLFACEALPVDFRIERIVFLSAALSPQVDLEPALRRSRRGIFNYYSPKDLWVLGLGTRLLGTTDRVRGRSAGLVGFDASDDPNLDAKLTQLEWTPSMRQLGNRGGHFGAFAPGFIRAYLLPLLEKLSAISRELSASSLGNGRLFVGAFARQSS